MYNIMYNILPCGGIGEWNRKTGIVLIYSRLNYMRKSASVFEALIRIIGKYLWGN